jgi:hypothetical protein
MSCLRIVIMALNIAISSKLEISINMKEKKHQNSSKVLSEHCFDAVILTDITIRSSERKET